MHLKFIYAQQCRGIQISKLSNMSLPKRERVARSRLLLLNNEIQNVRGEQHHQLLLVMRDMAALNPTAHRQENDEERVVDRQNQVAAAEATVDLRAELHRHLPI